ncbi:dTMP kinase [Caldivirga sp.]|uniref:dTMP kinase n=1 Tax=Caldivirga sp. TaxID=2080243 RepID=UPI0025BAA514|nr:dTMP kinase [Caldivirga sp.]
MCILVDVEGIDGVGKSTVIRLTADELRRRGYLVYVTSEPSDSPIGLFIRKNVLESNLEVEPTALALLFAADRVVHYNRVIRPKVQEGYIVITERYVESTVAYQGSQGVPIEWIMEINSTVAEPDLVIILNAPLSTVAGRLTSRGTLEYFERNISFLKSVQETYLRRARERNYPVIDASRLIKDVVNDVLTLIEDKAQGKCKNNN